MKILFLAGMYPTPNCPQNGIFCHEQVKALKSLGEEVDVFVPFPFYDKELTRRTWEFEGVKIEYFPFFKLPGTLDFHRLGKSLLRALKRVCSIKDYDIIHADAALPTGQAAMLAHKKYGIPYVVHGHGLDVFLDVSYQGKRTCNRIVKAGKAVYQEASAIIGVSQKVIDNIQERMDVAEKSYVAYNGVDINEFTPKACANEKIQLIEIGNLIPLKGHGYTLQALKILNEKYPDRFYLNLLGRGYLERDLKELAKSLEIEHLVDFKGYLPYREVVAQLQQADVFVLPSYYEALGCVYLEAMACGLPAIGCWRNGIDEIIEDGVDGYLIEGKNVQAIVNALEQLTDEKVRLRVGKNARKKVENGFTWMHSAQAVQKVYKIVLQREKASKC